jgi:hypothetical protein
MKLKKCPFCWTPEKHGGEAEITETDDGAKYIRCKQCDAATRLMWPLKDSVDELLAESWNTRPTEDKQAEQIARLQAKLEQVKDTLHAERRKLESENKQQADQIAKLQAKLTGQEKMNYPAAIVELRKIIKFGDDKSEAQSAEIKRLRQDLLEARSGHAAERE